MTDIYLGKKGPRKTRVILMILGLLVLTAGGLWWARRSPVASTLPDGRVLDPVPEDGTRPAPLPSLKELQVLVEGNELNEARELALAILDTLQDRPSRQPIERLLGDVHTRLVFSQRSMPEKIEHTVQSGDTLGELARTYNTTPERIAAINGIERNLIRVGDTLHILQGDFRGLVSKTRNEMDLIFNDRFFKRYAVGTGTDSSTPVGEYKITLRLARPTWYRPDGKSFAYGHPENLLGTHYLKLNTPGIGLHGTWEPDTVGSQSSAGCVRFKNEDIEELYHLLPEGTEIVILD